MAIVLWSSVGLNNGLYVCVVCMTHVVYGFWRYIIIYLYIYYIYLCMNHCTSNGQQYDTLRGEWEEKHGEKKI